MKKQILLTSLAFLAFTRVVSAQQQIQLSILDTQSSLPDYASLYFNPGTSTAYVPPSQDIVKILNTDTAFPQIYSLTSDVVGCYSNGFGDFTSATTITLGFRVKGGSTYRISASPSGFQPTSIIRLEDRTLGVFHNLLQGPYDVQIAQFEHSENRFFLHISYPPTITTTVAGCSNDDGIITINQEPSITWTSCNLWYGGSIINSFSNINGGFNFSGLVEGSYIVEFSLGTYSTQPSVTVGGRQIQTSVTVPTLNGVTGEAMNFSAVSSHTDSYSWDFGDGSEINGVANPEYTFLEAGTYTVTVVCTNIYGCSDTATITVVIGQGTGVKETNDDGIFISCCSKNLNINFSKPTSANEFELYNMEGKKLFANPIVSSNTNVALNNLCAGVYIVAIKGAQNYFSRKIILTE